MSKLSLNEWVNYFLWKLGRNKNIVWLDDYPELSTLHEKQTEELKKRLDSIGIDWYDGSHGGRPTLALRKYSKQE